MKIILVALDGTSVNTTRRPPPHAVAGRGVFDFLLPVSSIHLYFDFYSYVIINFGEFAVDFDFLVDLKRTTYLSKHSTTKNYYSNNFYRSGRSTKILNI